MSWRGSFGRILPMQLEPPKKRGGIPTPVRIPGPDLPRDPVAVLLLRRMTTLKTAAEGVAPWRVPWSRRLMGRRGLTPHFRGTFHYSPPVSCLGGKTPKKGSGIGTSQQDTHEETVEMDMSSPPAAATFNTRAAYAARVGEEALRSGARRDGSSGRAEDPWVPDPRARIWTMGGPSVGEAEPRPREDMEIRGVYSHSLGNGSSGDIRLWVSSLRMSEML